MKSKLINCTGEHILSSETTVTTGVSGTKVEFNHCCVENAALARPLVHYSGLHLKCVVRCLYPSQLMPSLITTSTFSVV